MKEIHWQGTSFEDLKAMPKGVQRNAGYQLHLIQVGLEPTDWKPMKSIGTGVREIRIHHNGQYRIIYVTIKKNTIYVLHSFQKKTQKTSKKDLNLAKARLKEIK